MNINLPNPLKEVGGYVFSTTHQNIATDLLFRVRDHVQRIGSA